MMSKIKRDAFFVLKNRLEEPRRFIQVVTGPRQIGKTTTVLQVAEELPLRCHYVSADSVPDSSELWIEQVWETVRLMNSQSQTSVVLVFDEIQKIRGWSEVVKKCWDQDTREGREIRVVLLGSSRLLIQHGLTESLAGRFELIRMDHWSFEEMERAFGWTPEQYVWFGGYPGSASLIGEENRWSGYIRNSLIDTSLNQDIMLLTRIDKPALLRQLFELGCHYSGQILALNKLLGTMTDAGNTTTLSGYLRLLDEAGLLTGLQKISGSLVRQRASSPKFQVRNNALYAVNSGISFNSALSDSAKWGRAVESAIGVRLLSSAQTAGIEVFWWREGNQEVDFVLKKGMSVLGIEVKSGSTTRSQGIAGFKKQFPHARLIRIGSDGLSWKDFLRTDISRLI